MTRTLNRRGFLAASAAMAAAVALPRHGFAQTSPIALRATTRTLDIDGRAATVFGLVNGAGGQGLVLDPGQRFLVNLTNDLDVPTIVHWANSAQCSGWRARHAIAAAAPRRDTLL